MVWRRICLLHIAVITVAGWIAFSPALSADFVYDDSFFTTQNPAIRSFRYAPFYFVDKHTTSATGHGIYRPMRTLCFAVDHALWGFNPKGYHLTNLLFHLAAGVMLYILILKMLRRSEVALFSALLFTLHPVQVEAVAYVSSRGDVMDGFFLISAFLFWIFWTEAEEEGKTNAPVYIASLALYAVAQFSKENATAFIILLVLHDFCFRNGRLSDFNWFTDKAERARRFWRGRAFIPFAGLTLFYLLLRTAVLGQVGQASYLNGSFINAQLSMLWGWIKYARLIFFPTNLVVLYHPPPPIGQMVPRLLLSAIVLFAFAAWVYWLFRRKSFTILFFLGWGAALMLPAAHIVPINAFIAERLLYLAMAGWALPIVWFALEGWKGNRDRGLDPGRIGGVCLTVVCVCLSVLTYQRSMIWQRPFSLWSDAVAKEPTYTAYTNLGLSYASMGMKADALEAYQSAQMMWPDGVAAHTNAGGIYLAEGRLSEAKREYEKAAELESENSQNWVNLGNVLLAMKDDQGAIAVLQKALALNPNEALGLLHLGEGLMRQGRASEAVDAFRRVTSLRPDLAPAYLRLGRACELLEDVICAQGAYARFLEFPRTSLQERSEAKSALSRINASIKGDNSG